MGRGLRAPCSLQTQGSVSLQSCTPGVYLAFSENKFAVQASRIPKQKGLKWRGAWVPQWAIRRCSLPSTGQLFGLLIHSCSKYSLSNYCAWHCSGSWGNREQTPCPHGPCVLSSETDKCVPGVQVVLYARGEMESVDKVLGRTLCDLYILFSRKSLKRS